MRKFALLISLLLLPACTFSGTNTTKPQEPENQIADVSDNNAFTVKERELIETYIRTNIVELSPIKAVLGGGWLARNIHWQDDGSAVVEYEDGHIGLTAYFEPVINDDGTVTIERFLNVDIPNQAAVDASEKFREQYQ